MTGLLKVIGYLWLTASLLFLSAVTGLAMMRDRHR